MKRREFFRTALGAALAPTVARLLPRLPGPPTPEPLPSGIQAWLPDEPFQWGIDRSPAARIFMVEDLLEAELISAEEAILALDRLDLD